MKKVNLIALLAALVVGMPSGAQAQIPGVRGQGPFVQGVVLTIQVVEADGFGDVDPAIADVVEELRSVFRFDGYRLLDTWLLRAALSVPIQRPDVQAQTRVSQRQGALEIEAWLSRTAAPDAVRVVVRLLDTSGEYINNNGRRISGPAIIDVSVTVRSGQTVVLGSGRPSGAANALILVMSVELDMGPEE